jgi:hypothetical protein
MSPDNLTQPRPLLTMQILLDYCSIGLSKIYYSKYDRFGRKYYSTTALATSIVDVFLLSRSSCNYMVTWRSEPVRLRVFVQSHISSVVLLTPWQTDEKRNPLLPFATHETVSIMFYVREPPTASLRIDGLIGLRLLSRHWSTATSPSKEFPGEPMPFLMPVLVKFRRGRRGGNGAAALLLSPSGTRQSAVD